MTDNLVQVARSAIGTPFRMWGRNLQSGIDCAGVIALPASEAGFACDALLKRPLNRTHRRPLRTALETDCEQIRVAEARVGDILLLVQPFVRTIRGNKRVFIPEIEHICLVTEHAPLLVLQANPYPFRRVVEHSLDDRVLPSRTYRWRDFVREAFRLKTK